MPRKTSETIVDTTGPAVTPLSEIPQSVKDYVEETYAKQRKVSSRERAVYDTAEELAEEFKLMVDYGAQRPAGILKLRRSPTRRSSLPANLRKAFDDGLVMDFRVSADVPANGARNEGNDRRQPVGSQK